MNGSPAPSGPTILLWIVLGVLFVFIGLPIILGLLVFLAEAIVYLFPFIVIILLLLVLLKLTQKGQGGP